MKPDRTVARDLAGDRPAKARIVEQDFPMANTISNISIEGFKSIRKLENFELRNLNVLIGANGAGKSNFISVFRFLNQIVGRNLQVAVAQGGGADHILYHGRRGTARLAIRIVWRSTNEYRFALFSTPSDTLGFAEEHVSCHSGNRDFGLGAGHFESRVAEEATQGPVASFVLSTLRSSRVYHFHDTSDVAKLKGLCDIQNNIELLPDAANLAAFLYRLKQTRADRYDVIVKTVRMAAPFFHDFSLRPNPLNTETIRLQWFEAGSEAPFSAFQLSDGTLRFICLATLLLQPSEQMPATIILDEPELGLHPYAITLLAALLRQAGCENQVIVATQSVPLVDELEPEDLIVVDRAEGQTVFHRPSAAFLSGWLKEYSLGELWRKNILNGFPGPIAPAVDPASFQGAYGPEADMPDWTVDKGRQ